MLGSLADPATSFLSSSRRPARRHDVRLSVAVGDRAGGVARHGGSAGIESNGFVALSDRICLARMNLPDDEAAPPRPA